MGFPNLIASFCLHGLILWNDSVDDSVKMVHLQELYGGINTVNASVCIFLWQLSRSALHKASIIGQYEEVKKYLSSGYAVDVKDQVLNYPFEKWIWYVVSVIESAAYVVLFHVTREFHSIKLICRNLYYT